MKVVNLSRSVTLVDSGRLATSYWERTRGLLFRPPLAEGEGLLLRPCQAVHTFLMSFPIDVLFLDKHNRVVHLIHAMPPNRASRFVRRAHSTLELPAGTIARTATQVGDLLSTQP